MGRALSDQAFLEKRINIDPGGCWEWTGTPQGNGYGTLTRENKQWLAHRWVYTVLVGPIPDGLHVDHICRNRGCVNPEHLRVVTPGENVLEPRSLSPCRLNADKTHCKRGHELKPDNLEPAALRVGKRICSECRRLKHREYYALRKRAS